MAIRPSASRNVGMSISGSFSASPLPVAQPYCSWVRETIDGELSYSSTKSTCSSTASSHLNQSSHNSHQLSCDQYMQDYKPYKLVNQRYKQLLASLKRCCKLSVPRSFEIKAIVYVVNA